MDPNTLLIVAAAVVIVIVVVFALRRQLRRLTLRIPGLSLLVEASPLAQRPKAEPAPGNVFRRILMLWSRISVKGRGRTRVSGVGMVGSQIDVDEGQRDDEPRR